MALESMSIGIVLERRDSDHKWETEVWRPVAVLPGGGVADGADGGWREIARGEGWEHYFAGTVMLELHHTDTADYRYNLAIDPPAVYVVLREDLEVDAGIAPFSATVSPSEAQALLDAEENIVEAVAMPPAIVQWVGAFTERYHVEQPHYKRKRTPHDPRKGGPAPARGRAE